MTNLLNNIIPQHTLDDIAFNSLDLAIVGFNAEGILLKYNKKLLTLWQLDEDFIANKPNMVEFFETLREKGIYPELDNFRQYLQDLATILRDKDFYENKQKIILTNGVHLQQKTLKSNNSLLLMWEDTTNLWNSQYSLNHYKNIVQKIVDRNPNALLIIASNGIVEGYNAKFIENYKTPLNLLNNKPHIKEILKTLLTEENILAELLGNILSSRSFNFKINNNTNCYGIALPNSSMFVMFNDNIIVNNTQDIIDNEEIKTSVSNLQNILVSDLNQSIQTPINTILGLANLLAGEYIGNLNMRQVEYVEKILKETKSIATQLNYKVALSEISNDKKNYTSIDLNIFLANLIEQIQSLLKEKNIIIKINVEESLININHNYELLLKFFNLCFIYIVNQSLPNNEISITIEQKNVSKDSVLQTKTTIKINDTTKFALFTENEQQNNYLVMLIFKIAKECGYDFKFLYKNRSHRLIEISFIC